MILITYTSRKLYRFVVFQSDSICFRKTNMAWCVSCGGFVVKITVIGGKLAATSLYRLQRRCVLATGISRISGEHTYVRTHTNRLLLSSYYRNAHLLYRMVMPFKIAWPPVRFNILLWTDSCKIYNTQHGPFALSWL